MALLALPVVAAAQAPADVPFTVRGAFLGLSTPDVASSARWYKEKLGLREVMNIPKRDKTTVIVLSGGGLTVELLQHDDATAPPAKPNYLVHGLFKVGITVDDLDKTLAALKARGVEPAMGPFPARGDQAANAIIRDNMGTFIQLFGPAPR